MEGLTPAEISAKGSMIQAEMLLPHACRTQLQMSKPKTITEMVSEVEQFFAGRSSSWDDPKWTWRKLTYQPGSDNSRMKEDKASHYPINLINTATEDGEYSSHTHCYMGRGC